MKRLGPIGLLFCTLLAGCADEKQRDANGCIVSADQELCDARQSEPAGRVVVWIDDPAGYDSVRVEIFAGKTIESGRLLASTKAVAGSGAITLPATNGDFAVVARYHRGIRSLDAIDGGALQSAKNNGCTCYTLEPGTLSLDARSDGW